MSPIIRVLPISLADGIMACINSEARKASQELAQERGVFANFHKSIFRTNQRYRNATVTTIAPTGTLSIM